MASNPSFSIPSIPSSSSKKYPSLPLPISSPTTASPGRSPLAPPPKSILPFSPDDAWSPIEPSITVSPMEQADDDSDDRDMAKPGIGDEELGNANIAGGTSKRPPWSRKSSSWGWLKTGSRPSSSNGSNRSSGSVEGGRPISIPKLTMTKTTRSENELPLVGTGISMVPRSPSPLGSSIEMTPPTPSSPLPSAPLRGLWKNIMSLTSSPSSAVSSAFPGSPIPQPTPSLTPKARLLLLFSLSSLFLLGSYSFVASSPDFQDVLIRKVGGGWTPAGGRRVGEAIVGSAGMEGHDWMRPVDYPSDGGVQEKPIGHPHWWVWKGWQKGANGEVKEEAKKKAVACDPYAEPGFMYYPPSNPLHTTWIPFTPSCPPAPDYLKGVRDGPTPDSNPDEDDNSSSSNNDPRNRPASRLPSHSAHFRGKSSHTVDVSFLQNRTILLLGDSVDRQSLEYFPDLLHPHGILRKGGWYQRYVDDDDIWKEGDDGMGGWKMPWNSETGWWDDRGGPNEVRIPWLNTRIVNGFFYGMDDVDEFSVNVDWHSPGRFEERVDELFKVLTNAMEDKGVNGPSLIQFHSGLWDLAFFGRRDKRLNLSLTHPLSPHRIRWFHNRLKVAIRKVKETWPGVPIWYRKVHRVGEQFYASHDWGNGINMGEGFQNFFTDVRTHQIRAVQDAVAREEGLPVFDFGEIWEGYQQYQDKVHPHQYPGSVLLNQALLHHMWMESIGRQNWVTPQYWIQPLDPVPPKTAEVKPPLSTYDSTIS